MARELFNAILDFCSASSLGVMPGPVRLQPRPQARQAADRLRSALRPGRLPGGHRGVRRQYCRPMTLTSQVRKLRERFGLDHVVLVGDRGMITQARITEDLTKAGLDWITALRAPAIKALRDAGALQMSLFDERDMAAITAPDFPGERLIVCRNRGLGAERARKREDLLLATERDLARIAAAVARKRRPLRGQAEIGIAVGAVIDQHKMAKHFALAITDTCFTFTRKANEITAEAALDGIYIVRTSLPATGLDDTATVRNYKSLSLVERA